MQIFEKPVIEVEKFKLMDVICTSGDECTDDDFCLLLCDTDDCGSDLGAG